MCMEQHKEQTALADPFWLCSGPILINYVSLSGSGRFTVGHSFDKDNQIQSTRELGEDLFSSKTMTRTYSKCYTEMVKRQLAECSPSQSPDHNPRENLWLDLKRAVHVPSLCDLTELGQFCQEEWSQTAVSRCASLIEIQYCDWSQRHKKMLNTDLNVVNTYAITYFTWCY